MSNFLYLLHRRRIDQDWQHPVAMLADGIGVASFVDASFCNIIIRNIERFHSVTSAILLGVFQFYMYTDCSCRMPERFREGFGERVSGMAMD
jgi:hypothetical protein